MSYEHPDFVQTYPKEIKQNFNETATALEVLNFYKTNLKGKNAIVTGGASGIGIETVRALAHAGAKVIVPARRLDEAKKVVEDIQKNLPSDCQGTIEVEHLDLGSLKSVRAFAEKFNARNIPLHILINNAGVMACPFTKTEDGFEMQIGTNHLGHFLLTNSLLPSLLRGTPARVVELSSSGHKGGGKTHFDDLHYEKFPYNKWEAYGQSKLANILFARQFNKLYSEKGITANAVMPGGILTPLQRYLPEEEMKGLLASGGKVFLKTPEQGAATSIWAAVAPELEGIGGYYLEDTYFSYKKTGESVINGAIPQAFDDKLAEQLWDISVKQVNLS